MTSRRATQRRRANDMVPVIPGVMPDRTEASIEMAMRQAHEELPPVRHTRVSLQLHTPAEGLALIERVYGPHAVAIMQTQLDNIGGEEPTIIIATRLPSRTYHRPHPERPNR